MLSRQKERVLAYQCAGHCALIPPELLQAWCFDNPLSGVTALNNDRSALLQGQTITSRRLSLLCFMLSDSLLRIFLYLMIVIAIDRLLRKDAFVLMHNQVRLSG